MIHCQLFLLLPEKGNQSPLPSARPPAPSSWSLPFPPCQSQRKSSILSSSSSPSSNWVLKNVGKLLLCQLSLFFTTSTSICCECVCQAKILLPLLFLREASLVFFSLSQSNNGLFNFQFFKKKFKKPKNIGTFGALLDIKLKT